MQEQSRDDLELARSRLVKHKPEQQLRGKAPKGRAFRRGNAVSMPTWHSCQPRRGFLGVENSIWEVSHGKQKESQHVKAI